jgi:hypothetical protein
MLAEVDSDLSITTMDLAITDLSNTTNTITEKGYKSLVLPLWWLVITSYLFCIVILCFSQVCKLDADMDGLISV